MALRAYYNKTTSYWDDGWPTPYSDILIVGNLTRESKNGNTFVEQR